MKGAGSRRGRREDRVQVAFLEAVHRRCPQNPRVWAALGELYTRVGRYEDGLQMDLNMVSAYPEDPMAWYNLGCSYALVGQCDLAIEALTRAVEKGYSDWAWMSRDRDLEALRKDERFQALVRWLRNRALTDSSTS